MPLEADDIGIPMFSAHVQDTMEGLTRNIVQISEDFLETNDGTLYFRWIMEHNPKGTELHQAFYISGSGKWFLTAMYGRPKSAGSEYDQQIDEAIKTLSFE